LELILDWNDFSAELNIFGNSAHRGAASTSRVRQLCTAGCIAYLRVQFW
jgi:hypothetical protein